MKIQRRIWDHVIGNYKIYFENGGLLRFNETSGDGSETGTLFLVAPDTTIFYKDKKWVPNPYIAEELRRYALGLMAFVEVLKAFPKLSLRGEYDCVQEYSLDGLTLGELETLN